jgi:hypothetical protein
MAKTGARELLARRYPKVRPQVQAHGCELPGGLAFTGDKACLQEPKVSLIGGTARMTIECGHVFQAGRRRK